MDSRRPCFRSGCIAGGYDYELPCDLACRCVQRCYETSACTFRSGCSDVDHSVPHHGGCGNGCGLALGFGELRYPDLMAIIDVISHNSPIPEATIKTITGDCGAPHC